MTKRQATKANKAQIEQHVKRQRAGLKGEWEQDHPVVAAIIGATVLVLTIAGMGAAWIAQGAQL